MPPSEQTYTYIDYSLAAAAVTHIVAANLKIIVGRFPLENHKIVVDVSVFGKQEFYLTLESGFSADISPNIVHWGKAAG